MSEKELQSAVRAMARLYRWADYCTWNSRHSPKGWPDLVLIRPPRIIFAELKSATGKLTGEQDATLELLRECNLNEVYVWRPADLQNIAEILR